MSHTVDAPQSAALPQGSASPRGRPSWSGLLQLSLVTVPVKAYPAVSSSDASHFHQLHADCGQRIRYEKRCPVHGPVDSAAIAKGYPYAPDQYVVVEADELDRLRPAQDRALRLERFTEARHIDPTLFAGRSLYLLPDGLAAQRPYQVLADSLRQRGRWAIGRVVLSGHRQLVVVRPAATVLAVDVLHFPAQVRAVPAADATGAAPATPEELQLAGLLIDAASGPIDWSQYRDDSAHELRALIEAKLAGRPLAATADAAPANVASLLAALRQSVAAMRGAPAKSDAPASPPQRPKRRRTA